MTLLLLWWMLCCSYSNEKKSLLFLTRMKHWSNDSRFILKLFEFLSEQWPTSTTTTWIALKKSYDCFRQICIISLLTPCEDQQGLHYKTQIPTNLSLTIFILHGKNTIYACLCCTCHCEFGISFFSVSLIPSNKTETVISPFCFLFSPNFFHSFFWCIYVPEQ